MKGALMNLSASIRSTLLLPTLLLGATAADAQSLFATQVVAYAPGAGGGIFVPTNALGGPTGQGFGNGSLDVASLGAGGSLTLGFDVLISDGPGSDFTVFENALVAGGEVFAEVAFVEVSSDAVHFARMPSSYAGPVGGFGGFTAPFGTYAGLTGGLPVLANVTTNPISPFDPVVSGGEAFDLAALAGDPAVVAGLVDLGAIRYVRIVDSLHGVDVDSNGAVVWDNAGPTGSADVDAVAVIHHAGAVDPHAPAIDLHVDAQGFLALAISDPDGLGDVDRATIAASFDLQPISLRRLRALLPDATPIPNGVLLRSALPVATSGLRGVLAVSARDHAGALSSDQIAVQG